MKVSKLFIILSLAAMTFVSCASAPPTIAGTLPKKWWKLSRGEVQNHYRGQASGPEAEVIIFIGMSDSLTNVDESTAIENARMDAFVKLSQFLASKVTAIRQSAKHQELLQASVEDGLITEDDAKVLSQKITTKLGAFSASVTSTQFSSFKEEAFYTEENDGRYKAWVCYSMSDQVLEETQELQRKAFETLMEETEKYKELMKSIQESIADQLLTSIQEEGTL